ncbi:MAG: NAD(P)/FAD-dependent oxidoreductase [Bacilli bacterium]
MKNEYDVVVIGGGAGGLQAAIHSGRYHWRTLVIDRGKGRTFYTPIYHNLLGYPDGVSGAELLSKGKQQAKKYGVEFLMKVVTDITKDADGMFTITAQRRKEYREGSHEHIDIVRARKIVLATGIMDRHPDVPDVYHWAGFSIYYCPDCDGYEITDERVVVIGRGNGGPGLANTLLSWTADIAVVNIDPAKEISDHWKTVMQDHDIPIYTGAVKEFVGKDRHAIEQVILEDNTVIPCNKVFSALGMYSVHSELGKKIGVETLENGHIVVDPRTKQTSVEGVWAVGDVVAHSQQVMIAIGEGAQAAIWVNKTLRQEGLLPVRKRLLEVAALKD